MHKLLFFLIGFISFFFLDGCGKLNHDSKPVLHLFSDAQFVEAQGMFAKAEGEEIQSKLTYPHDDTLWVMPWQGKQALAFQSGVQGILRGSLHLFRDVEAPDFSLNLSAWLGLGEPETWTGMLFWMPNRNNRALGVRWKVNAALKKVEVEFFRYNRPELAVVAKRAYALDQSHWANVKIQVINGALTVQLDGGEALRAELKDEWHAGNFIGFFQGFGIGYFADLAVEAGGRSFIYEDVMQTWNEEMVNTARRVALDNFPTPDDLVGAPVTVRRIALANEWRVAAPVMVPSRLAFKTQIPEQGVLHVSYGIMPAFAMSDTKAVFEVLVDAGAGEKVLHSRAVHPRQESISAFRYLDTDIPLKEYAGKEIKLILQTRRESGEEPLGAVWSEPALASARNKKKPNVLVILLDTLRADRLGAYGNKRGLTPQIDRFAKEGTTFLHAISQAPWTTPSHASLFTSLYPSETGCGNAALKGNLLQEGYITLAEHFQRNGYNTAAFTSGIQMRGELGFHQGFDRYQDVEYDKAYSMETLFERTREFWDKHEDEPWFLFFHTYAVHFPYEHEQYVEYRTSPRGWEDHKILDNDTYDGGVRFADEWVGNLLEELRKRGLEEDTWVILTSDHGEDLGERGMPVPARHGHTLYDEVLKVPLIMRWPGTIPDCKTVESQACLLDVLPTVLDGLGWKTPSWSHGLSLFPLIRGEKEAERVALSEGLTYGVGQVSLRTQHYKLIVTPDSNNTLDPTPNLMPLPVPEAVRLFDLRSDPQENTNIAETHPEKKDEMMKVLDLIRKNQFPQEMFTHGNVQELPPMSDTLMEEMKSMGYLAK